MAADVIVVYMVPAKEAPVNWVRQNNAEHPSLKPRALVEHGRSREYVPEAGFIHACMPSRVEDLLCDRAALGIRWWGVGKR